MGRSTAAVIFFIFLLASALFAGVTVSSPSSGTTASSPVHFVASASSSNPITTMRIYVDYKSAYTVSSSKLDTYLAMSTGSHNVVVQAWDSSGAVFKSNLSLNVTATTTRSVTVSSPSDGATVPSPVHFVASATSNYPVTRMRIYSDYNQVYDTAASSIDTNVALSQGAHKIVVQAWDSTGAAFNRALNINVSGTTTSSSSTSSSGVTVSSPSNGATVSSPVHFVASATSSNPITRMRIYSDSSQVYDIAASSIDTNVALSQGGHSIVVQAWDSAGTVFKQSMNINVSGTNSSSTGDTTAYPSGSKTFSNIDAMASWDSCDSCSGPGGAGSTIPYSMTQNVSSPSLDGGSAQFWVGGTKSYGSALWWKQLGSNSNVSHFVYDLYFYVKDSTAAFALEFDVNQSTGGKRYIMGTQCGNNYDKQWDVWDPAQHWVPTGISCTGIAPYTWHHLVEEFYRANGRVYYVSITLDGVKHYINRNYAAGGSSANDINVAFQMDENSKAIDWNAWLDKIKLTYW